MTLTHQTYVDLSQMDLSDWRKRIHQLKQELRANTPNPKPLLAPPPLTYGSPASSKPTGGRIAAT